MVAPSPQQIFPKLLLERKILRLEQPYKVIVLSIADTSVILRTISLVA